MSMSMKLNEVKTLLGTAYIQMTFGDGIDLGSIPIVTIHLNKYFHFQGLVRRVWR